MSRCLPLCPQERTLIWHVRTDSNVTRIGGCGISIEASIHCFADQMLWNAAVIELSAVLSKMNHLLRRAISLDGIPAPKAAGPQTRQCALYGNLGLIKDLHEFFR
jgi:hypothetical protein